MNERMKTGNLPETASTLLRSLLLVSDMSCKIKGYILSQIGNANEIPMHFNTQSNAIDKIRAKSEVMKTSHKPTKRGNLSNCHDTGISRW
jgi:hypothetical protein